jgi:CheY-like chemotaxis protein
MTSPLILVLEDEKAQLLAVRAALRGLGEIREFADPRAALAFSQEHALDAAVVDVHMPAFDFDGMDFIRAIRSFDRDVCVIIRTGDNSTDLADGAIEVRAFRRAIKGRTSVDELRSLAAAAVMETRSRRQITADAAEAEKMKAHWARTLGSTQEMYAVSANYRGLFQGMRNRLTALAGTAEVISEATADNRLDLLKEHSSNNRRLVGGLLTEINAFLDSPFAHALHELANSSHGTANRVLEALERHFLGSQKWSVDRKSLAIVPLDQDMFISASPLNLLTAIRHLIEYALERSRSGTVTRVTANYSAHPADALQEIGESIFVLTEQAVTNSCPCVNFRVSAPVEVPDDDIRRAFDECPDDPRSGNLQMIPLALRGDFTALVVHSPERSAKAFDLYVPTNR